MEKFRLEKFIRKYYLDTIDSVVWKSGGDFISVTGVSEDNNVVVSVEARDVNFPAGIYGVYNTKKLLSLLSALGDTIEIENLYSQNSSTPIGLKLSDGPTTVNYILSDPSIIKDAPSDVNLPKFEVSVAIDENLISTFLRGKSALSEEDLFTVYSNGESADITLGYSRNNTNRITMSRKNDNGQSLSHINFSAKYMKEILSSNKDVSDGGTMKVSSRGVAYIHFDGPTGFDSKYYLLQIKKID